MSTLPGPLATLVRVITNIKISGLVVLGFRVATDFEQKRVED